MTESGRIPSEPEEKRKKIMKMGLREQIIRHTNERKKSQAQRIL